MKYFFNLISSFIILSHFIISDVKFPMAYSNKTNEFYKLVFVEFVEVLIHQIIFIRKLYPESIYETRKKFNIPVKMSQHPWVNKYIDQVMETINKYLYSEETDFDSIDIVISEDGKVTECYKLEFANLDQIKHTQDEYLHRIELSLASILLRLGNAVSSLKKTEHIDREWRVELGSNVKGARTLISDKTWCLAETDQQDKVIIPVMGISDPLKLQLYIETNS